MSSPAVQQFSVSNILGSLWRTDFAQPLKKNPRHNPMTRPRTNAFIAPVLEHLSSEELERLCVELHVTSHNLGVISRAVEEKREARHRRSKRNISPLLKQLISLAGPPKQNSTL